MDNVISTQARPVFEGTCFMAIELSKANWLIGMLTPLSDKISLRSIPCGGVQQLMEIIGRTTERIMQATGQPVRIVSCYEAGYDGFWLHRVLEAHGISNHALDGPAPYGFICKCWASQLDRFIRDPIHRLPGPNT